MLDFWACKNSNQHHKTQILMYPSIWFGVAWVLETFFQSSFCKNSKFFFFFVIAFKCNQPKLLRKTNVYIKSQNCLGAPFSILSYLFINHPMKPFNVWNWQVSNMYADFIKENSEISETSGISGTEKISWEWLSQNFPGNSFGKFLGSIITNMPMLS